MSFKFKWITYLLCICAVSYITIVDLPKILAPNKDQDKTAVCISRVIESNSIQDVLHYVENPQTIAVFDLDNTLVYPKQDLGSDRWFYSLFNPKLEAGMSRKDALAIVIPIYYEVYNHIPLYPVEPEGPKLLLDLQQKGITTIALTTKSLPLVPRTLEQLKDAGFAFTQKAPFDQELTVTLEKPALLTHGIIFCNDNNKGPTLLKVLELCHCKPEKVVFVDDSLKHLLDVERECVLNKINFVGIRYGKLDSYTAQFDPVRAEQQYKNLLGKDYSGNPVNS